MRMDWKMQSKTAFDREAAGYDQAQMCAPLRARYRDVVNEALCAPFSNCLDVGCGTGALLSMIAQARSGVSLYGVNLSERMIAVACATLGDKARLQVGDSERPPFDAGMFELVTCTFSFHHCRCRAPAGRHARRAADCAQLGERANM